MGAGLYAGERIYRQALDEALSGLDPDLESDVRRLVRPPDASAAGARRIDETSHTLPALVAVEYAIGRLLQAWGMRPAGTIGEGPGEYAAACFAGVLDIHQAMALAAFESRLLQRLDAGTPLGAHGAAPAARGHDRGANRRVRAILPHGLVQAANHSSRIERDRELDHQRGSHRPQLLGATAAPRQPGRRWLTDLADPAERGVRRNRSRPDSGEPARSTTERAAGRDTHASPTR